MYTTCYNQQGYHSYEKHVTGHQQLLSKRKDNGGTARVICKVTRIHDDQVQSTMICKSFRGKRTIKKYWIHVESESAECDTSLGLKGEWIKRRGNILVLAKLCRSQTVQCKA